MSKPKVVLKIHGGGLGDSLLYSTCPEMWVRQLNAEVFIETIGFRTEGIPDLIWKHNPFISGFTSERATHSLTSDAELRRQCIVHQNNIMGTEAYVGLSPKNRFPKIYWQPQYLSQFRNKVVVDPTGVTLMFDDATFRSYINYLVECNVLQQHEIIMMDAQIRPGAHNHVLPEYPRHVAQDIFETASIIYSCRKFITNHSGLAALASAIKGANPYPEVHSIIAQAVYNKKIWKWDNLDYSVTGSLVEDFRNI